MQEKKNRAKRQRMGNKTEELRKKMKPVNSIMNNKRSRKREHRKRNEENHQKYESWLSHSFPELKGISLQIKRAEHKINK